MWSAGTSYGPGYFPKKSIDPNAISVGFQKALSTDRATQKANAKDERIQQLEAKITALDFGRTPQYYREQFGEPGPLLRLKKGYSALGWDMPEVTFSVFFKKEDDSDDLTRVGYCVVAVDEKFHPVVPFADFRLGDQALDALADTYIFYNYGSGGRQTISKYGPDGGKLANNSYGYIGYVEPGVYYQEPEVHDEQPFSPYSTSKWISAGALGGYYVNLFALFNFPNDHWDLRC